MSKLIVNCETGEEILKELSKTDKDQQKIDEVKSVEFEAEIKAKAAQRQAIFDRLGLTADEAKLIFG